LTQVFVNLLVNAAQALGSSQQGRITVSSARVGDRVVTTIADNGPGIRAEHLPRVFDAYFTTKASGSGTGIGLTISREIVRASGGELRVDSVFGQGATFTVVMPHAEPARHSAAPARRVADPPRALARLLFVDDEANIRRGYQRLFGKRYDIALAEEGEQALAMLTEREFDVIVTDLLMPKMHGTELYRRVVATRPELGCRFVFVTGGTSDPEVKEFLRCTSNPVLEKPFEHKMLADVIDGLHHGARASERILATLTSASGPSFFDTKPSSSAARTSAARSLAGRLDHK
jgi:CheY-like chemotaxis protein